MSVQSCDGLSSVVYFGICLAGNTAQGVGDIASLALILPRWQLLASTIALIWTRLPSPLINILHQSCCVLADRHLPEDVIKWWTSSCHFTEEAQQVLENELLRNTSMITGSWSPPDC